DRGPPARARCRARDLRPHPGRAARAATRAPGEADGGGAAHAARPAPDAAGRGDADRSVGAEMNVRASHIAPAALTTAAPVPPGQLTNRTLVLPLLNFFPTSRCNSRCISCDLWKRSG